MRPINYIIKTINVLRRNFLPCNLYAKSIGVKMGEGCMLNTKEFSSEAYLIEMGDYVRVAKHVRFFTHGGMWSQRKRHPELLLEQFGKIKIGDYSYIGEGCMIMPGVEIGSNCIVGAGSVVTKSIPDGVMVAGNPVRYIGMTDDFVKKVSENPSIDSKAFYRLNSIEREKYVKGIPDERLIKKGILNVGK
jgi:acetyltransferase-like isoleucine patch superfamily enzyme